MQKPLPPRMPETTGTWWRVRGRLFPVVATARRVLGSRLATVARRTAVLPSGYDRCVMDDPPENAARKDPRTGGSRIPTHAWRRHRRSWRRQTELRRCLWCSTNTSAPLVLVWTWGLFYEMELPEDSTSELFGSPNQRKRLAPEPPAAVGDHGRVSGALHITQKDGMAGIRPWRQVSRIDHWLTCNSIAADWWPLVSGGDLIDL